jgi:hypothetical protein
MALGRLLRAIFKGRPVAVDDGGECLDSHLSDRIREQSIPTNVKSKAINSPAAPKPGESSNAKLQTLGADRFQVLAKEEERGLGVFRVPASGEQASQSGDLLSLSTVTSVHSATIFWLEQIRGRNIKSVLDLKSATGDRAQSLIQAIVLDTKSAPKYATVEQFDTVSGSLSLIELHRLVRIAGGHLVPLPGSITDSLQRLSRTLGTVDMVLLGCPQSEFNDSCATRLISRVVHADTLVFEPCGDTAWRPVSLPCQRMTEIARLRKTA